jgi:hypothetical protein
VQGIRAVPLVCFDLAEYVDTLAIPGPLALPKTWQGARLKAWGSECRAEHLAQWRRGRMKAQHRARRGLKVVVESQASNTTPRRRRSPPKSLSRLVLTLHVAGGMALFASTYASHSGRQLLRQLTSIPHLKSPDPAHTLLFSIAPSAGLANDALADIVSLLNAHPRAVGCLAAPISLPRSRTPSARACTQSVCSVAVFDAGAATPFRSTIPGKEAVQVGRWHAFRKKDDDETALATPLPNEPSSHIDWERVWARKTPHALPAALQPLKCALPFRAMHTD